MNSQLPLVSAIMAARDAASTIDDAIASVLAQSHVNFELIVVDDGSRDATRAVVEAIDDPRLTLINTESRGRGHARNTALAHATGEYVAICDADDISLPARFRRQLAFLAAHPEVGVVATQVLDFGTWGPPRQRLQYPHGDAEIRARLSRGRSAVPNQSAMIRRALFESVGSYTPQCLRAQDFEFFLRCASKSSFATLPEALVLYRTASRVPLPYWLENAAYQRYAVHVAEARLAGSPIPDPPDGSVTAQFVAQRIGDLLGYVRHRYRQRSPQTAALR